MNDYSALERENALLRAELRLLRDQLESTTALAHRLLTHPSLTQPSSTSKENQCLPSRP